MSLQKIYTMAKHNHWEIERSPRDFFQTKIAKKRHLPFLAHIYLHVAFLGGGGGGKITGVPCILIIVFKSTMFLWEKADVSAMLPSSEHKTCKWEKADARTAAMKQLQSWNFKEILFYAMTGPNC